MRLFSYFRSSAAFRVRIALNLKGIDYSIVPVNLAQGEHRRDDYRSIHPQSLIPALELSDGSRISQSMAIIEWLEESFPSPALLPGTALARARIRAICQCIACDIHPLNNLRVLHYLEGTLGAGKQQRDVWYQHWVHAGFAAIEPQLGTTPFVAGGSPGMAEVFMVPQVYNAQRFGVDMTAYPRIQTLFARCLGIEAFARAHPDEQSDSR